MQIIPLANPFFTVNNFVEKVNRLPFALFIIFVFWGCFLVVFTPKAHAVTIAEQTQNYGSTLLVFQAIQELGNNLSGIASSFTFRVSTSRSNLNQFDFTALNSGIYDKDNNSSYITGCVPSSSDPLAGLTFSTQGVPNGFEDVTIDFSCNKYDFVPGHRYLIKISNANMGNEGSGKILFAAAAYGPGGEQTTDRFTEGGLRYGNANIYDYANNSGSCSPTAYTWNGTDPWHNGCYVWTTPKDDLYFILSNNAPPPPPPKTPVIFIPGIGGSELKATQDIIWSKDDGHGGIFSHAYAGNEKVWVNQDEAVKLGDDDYFDVLRLKTDGKTSEADLSLTGSLTPFGYGDIDSFFTGLGYEKGKNFFVFPYDWRKDVRSTKDDLDSLIEQAKQKSGQSKVNLVVHSMGGLIARFYISDAGKAAKVNKLIELGVPHVGTIKTLKTLQYGVDIEKEVLGFIKIAIIPSSEIKDVFHNLPSAFQLLPSKYYFDFYDNSNIDQLYPFRDERDIDSNKITGDLNFDQLKTLLTNLGHNMPVFSFAEQLHELIRPLLNNNNGVKLYNIVGSSQPTLGQIRETWWITWPVNLIPKRDEVFINGDGTVPLYSASLKSSSKDFSSGATIYYTEQEHIDLVRKDGTAMQIVKSILNDDNSLPVEVKTEKINLEGDHLSLDDGELDLYDDQNRHCGLKDNGEEIEENIPEVSCTTSGKTKHAFVKKKASKVKVKATRKKPATSSKTTSLKKRTYKQDKISKTSLYRDIPLTQTAKVEFTLDPTIDTSPSLTFYADATKPDTTIITQTSEATGSAALDQTPPTTSIQISGIKDASGIYTGPVTITLTGSDSSSGILRIEYSLDNGQTVQTYTGPFTISTPGKTTIQFKSIDKLGNEEIPQTIIIEIAVHPSPIPTPTSSSTTSSSGSESSKSNSNSSTSDATSASTAISPSVIPSVSEESSTSISNKPSILGVSFKNPSHISDQINVSHILEEQKGSDVKIIRPSAKEILGGLLIVSGGIVALASVGLITTFLKQPPK